MFTKKGSFSILLIFTAFINSFHCFFGKKKSEGDLLEEARAKRQKINSLFEQSEKAINARVVAMGTIFPLGDSFLSALQQLFDEINGFFKQVSGIDRSASKRFNKEWSGIQKLIKI